MSYQGPAVLTVNGTEYDVTAELSITVDQLEVGEAGRPSKLPGLRSWGGTLASDDQQAQGAIGWAGELKLPDGKIGQVSVAGGSTDMDELPTEPVLLQVVGEGPAPFA